MEAGKCGYKGRAEGSSLCRRDLSSTTHTETNPPVGRAPARTAVNMVQLTACHARQTPGLSLSRPDCPLSDWCAGRLRRRGRDRCRNTPKNHCSTGWSSWTEQWRGSSHQRCSQYLGPRRPDTHTSRPREAPCCPVSRADEAGRGRWLVAARVPSGRADLRALPRLRTHTLAQRAPRGYNSARRSFLGFGQMLNLGT